MFFLLILAALVVGFPLWPSVSAGQPAPAAQERQVAPQWPQWRGPSSAGVSTEAEVSAKDVARIITQIRKQKIPAVFLENVTDERLLKRIGAESGARIGGTLYSDALTDANGQAATYLDMMRHNVKQIAAALAGV